MASKQELEEQVLKLQSELATERASSGADSAQSARVLDLEEKLKAADEHCVALENDLKTVAEELKVAQDAVLSQETEIKLLTEKKADTVTATVIAKGRMSDIVDQWRKKEIDDDAEVLVFKPN